MRAWRIVGRIWVAIVILGALFFLADSVYAWWHPLPTIIQSEAAFVTGVAVLTSLRRDR